MKIKSSHLLFATAFFTLLLVLIIAFFPINILRIVLGVPLVVFFPGYVLMSTLYPRKNALERTEKIALCFGMSIAIVVLAGLILNYTPWGISLYFILISLAVLVIVLSVTAFCRQRNLPEQEKPSITISIKKISIAGQSGTNKILIATLAIAVLCIIGMLVYAATTTRTGEKYTEFYILGQNGKASDYPSQITLGENGKVIAGIINHEQTTTSYRIEVKIDNISSNDSGPFSLADEEKSERIVSFTPQKAADQQKVEFLLYKNGQDQPYQSLYFWVGVK
jgi:uncharacterized membrane protein